MITIIDYGVGNIGSITNMLVRIGVSYDISDNPNDICSSKALLLPGVGAAGVGMQTLKASGIDVAIRRAVTRGIPLLGICLGMQLLFDYSEENDTPCLGVIPGSVRLFKKERKIPQIGWNTVLPNWSNRYSAPLFAGIPEGSAFYYVNSFYPDPDSLSVCAATTSYGETFTSVLATETIVATQFHPEKSGDVGVQFINNFIKEYV